MDLLITCKPEFEKVLAREAAWYHASLLKQGAGWIRVSGLEEADFQELCFAHYILKDPLAVKATSVNSCVAKLIDLFVAHLGDKRVTEPWSYLFFSSGNEDIIPHAKIVEECFFEKLKKKMSRVAKLAREGIPASAGSSEGLFVHLTAHNEADVSFQARSQGQQRMSMDPQAPSRSYLKIEESFHIFKRAPQDGETVIDLGAAPGGWSLSALKRGAKVIAIDNGPLREPVLSHPHIRHLESDALTYEPDGNGSVDWLLCDVLEDPELILNLLRKWFSRKWCRSFVVNLKVGRHDPVAVLKKIKDPAEGLSQYCQTLLMRQLYHDREEITLMGEVK
jgi:23S rRNA (cytidine2498-2'-O)-methyltransferase